MLHENEAFFVLINFVNNQIENLIALIETVAPNFYWDYKCKAGITIVNIDY